MPCEREKKTNIHNKIIMKERKLHFETLQVHAGQEAADPATKSRAVPIYQTAAYVFDDCRQAAARFSLEDPGNIYGRLTNPTQAVLESRIAALEGGVAALAVASGAAAITYSLLNILSSGDHVVAERAIYGGSYNLLANTLGPLGIDVTFVDAPDADSYGAAIRENTRAVFVETMGNPHSNLVDIDGIAAVAHSRGIPLIVDNTFATPCLFRPIEHGADVVVHSATKFIGGHGSSLGGLVVDSGNFDWEASGKYPMLTEPCPSYHGGRFTSMAGRAAYATRMRAILLRGTGATISPFNAFILLQGIETLSLRVERQVANALAIVDFLASHPKVLRVNHPSRPDRGDHGLYERYFPGGAGTIFTFDVDGGRDRAYRLIDSLGIFSLLANVADVKSLVVHPATTTHSQLSPKELSSQGLGQGTVRLSVGTEHVDDLIDDLARGLSLA